MALDFPQIDPVAFSLGPVSIRWYALAYITGILLGWRYVLHLVAKAPAGQRPNAVDMDDFISFAVMGILIGGRIGYVSFYNFGYYSQNFLDIFKLWEGGMSFHGGMLGVFVAMILFARQRQISFLRLADYTTVAAPIGLFFGRIANFINGELYGRVTELPWGMVFPRGGPQPRHPSQLYEAAGEGLLLFIVLWGLVRAGIHQRAPGALSGVFLLGYGLVRFGVEAVRAPDAHIGLLVADLSMGQILTLPMIFTGAAVIVWAVRQAQSAQASRS